LNISFCQEFNIQIQRSIFNSPQDRENFSAQSFARNLLSHTFAAQ